MYMVIFSLLLPIFSPSSLIMNNRKTKQKTKNGEVFYRDLNYDVWHWPKTYLIQYKIKINNRWQNKWYFDFASLFMNPKLLDF